MINFKNLPSDKTEEFTLTLKLKFTRSKLTEEEINDRIRWALVGFDIDASAVGQASLRVSEFIVDLLRETRSSMRDVLETKVEIPKASLRLEEKPE